MDIQWIGADPGNFQPGRAAGFQPEAVVIHVIDGSLASADSWFRDPKAKVSAHYGVGRDGRVHQYVKETDTAFHAGTVDQPSWPLLKPGVNPNHYTIGVEHEGTGTEPWPWPQAQLDASTALVAAITERWRIARDADHIVPHHAIRHAKTCPGVNFQLADYVGRLAALPPAVNQLGEVFALPLKVLTQANLRAFATTASAVRAVASPGAAFAATSFIADGEAVSGNAGWYRNANGEYLWAGATDRPHGA